MQYHSQTRIGRYQTQCLPKSSNIYHSYQILEPNPPNRSQRHDLMHQPQPLRESSALLSKSDEVPISGEFSVSVIFLNNSRIPISDINIIRRVDSDVGERPKFTRFYFTRKIIGIFAPLTQEMSLKIELLNTVISLVDCEDQTRRTNRHLDKTLELPRPRSRPSPFSKIVTLR